MIADTVNNDFIEAFREDVEDTYLGWDAEYMMTREFAFRGAGANYEVKKLRVIWNQDILKSLSSTVMYGQLMVGDVLLLTRKVDWNMRPRREQILYSPRDTPWKILFCQEILKTLYRISLEQVLAPL